MFDQTGDEARLNHLICLYETELLRVSFYFLKDKMLSEDAVQDTFFKVYKNIRLCPEGESEKAWIYKIALNTIRDAQRRMSVRKRFFISESTSFPDPSSPLSSDIIALHTAIMRLPRKMKEVILLYYYQEFSVTEIADILHLSQSSVSGRLKRARDRISKELKGEIEK